MSLIPASFTLIVPFFVYVAYFFQVTAGTVLLIEPVKHRGKAALTPVVTDTRGQLGCNFQRQRYDLCFSASSASNPEAFEACVGRGHENGALVLVTCPVNRPVGHYTTHPGLNPTTTAQRLEAYGRNVVSGVVGYKLWLSWSFHHI